MSPEAFNGWAAQWAPCMLRACWQGALAAAGVWVVCRLFRRLPASLRALLWWLVCLKTLVGLAVTGPLHLAVLPAAPAAAPVVVARPSCVPTPVKVSGGSTLPVLTSAGVGTVAEAAPVRPERRPERISPSGGLLCLWLAGVLILLGGVGREMRAARRLAEQAAPCDEAADIWEVTRAVGLTRSPRVLVSERTDCTVVIGPWRPAVVLCGADLMHLSRAEWRALLAHELIHIRRRDLWVGMVPNLARLLFFFNPIIWLACREYDLAREAACDAEAVRVSGMAPADYGRLLLKLSVAPPALPRSPRMATLGAASPYGALLRRRLQGLRGGSPVSRWVAGLALATAGGALLLNPVRVGARAALTPHRPAAPAREQAENPSSPIRETLPAVSVTPESVRTNKKEDHTMSKPTLSRTLATAAILAASPTLLAGGPAVGQETQPPAPVPPVPAVAPAAVNAPVKIAVAPRAVVAPKVAVAPKIAVNVSPISFQDAPAAQSSRYQFTLRRGDSYQVHTRDRGVGSAQRELAKAQSGDCLVVDRDGKRYVITDAETLKRVQENYAPVEAIGKQMEGLGKQMEEAAKPMEELGKQIEALVSKQMEGLGKQMEELGKQLEEASKENKPEADRKAIQEKMKATAEKMKVPHEEIKALTEKIKEQASKMKPSGEQMKQMGEKIRTAVKEAEARMNGILDDAFAKNLAVEQK